MDYLNSVAIYSCVLLIVAFAERLFSGLGTQWLLRLSRGGRWREVSIRVNVGTSAGMKNRGLCGEVAVVGRCRWPLLVV